MFTFVHFAGTNIPLARDVCGLVVGGSSVADLLVVLVVEDDPLIQTLIDEALRDGGYEPAIVASGEEAVTLLQGNREHYRALISDINLKGTADGWDVARQAREIDPSFPIVYMTGAAAEQWASHGVPNSILLCKPFAPAQLVTAISQLLNTVGQPAGPAP
jgi:CheY-like chemotaxis protein